MFQDWQTCFKWTVKAVRIDLCSNLTVLGTNTQQSSNLNQKRTNMKLSLSRYRSVLLVQISLLIVDLLINTFCEYLRFESVILLVIFVIQDVCLVFSLIIVFLSFFSTYIFQAGLVGVLVQQFRTPIFVTVLYIGKFIFW